jgi:hypothetical protein
MKKEKQFRTALNLIMLFVLMIATLVLVSGQESEPDELPGAGGGCKDLTGKWKTSTEHGSAVWELRKLREKDMYKPKQVIPSSGRQYLPGDQYLAGDGYVAGDGYLAGLLDDNTLKLEYDGQKQDTRESYTGIYLCKLDAKCQTSISPCVLHHGQPGRGRPDATYKATIKRQQ